MRIALIDPFFDDSHRMWAEGWQAHSLHEIDIYSGKAHYWKWKMTGGTITLADTINRSNKVYDLFLTTDMVNVPLFKSLLNEGYNHVPFYLYFHENQITYPWSPTDSDIKKKRDHHYGFINFCSALVSEKIFFNSQYHKDSLIGALPGFLKQFPDKSLIHHVKKLEKKSIVLPIGMDLPEHTSSLSACPVFIWNHRWEYDKNPQTFFNTLFQLKEQKVIFKLIVAGKSFGEIPDIFQKAKKILKSEIIHFGYVKSKSSYLNLLAQSNLLLVTSNQDFFGISIVEAIAAGCYPVLPDRLSYREHVSISEKVIYNNDDELLPLLSEVIAKESYLNTRPFSEYVRKYDWKNLIEKYDKHLSI